MTDLIFQVRIMDAAKRLGKPVRFVKDLAVVPKGVQTVIFDLGYTGVDPLAEVQY